MTPEDQIAQLTRERDAARAALRKARTQIHRAAANHWTNGKLETALSIIDTALSQPPADKEPGQ